MLGSGAQRDGAAFGGPAPLACPLVKHKIGCYSDRMTLFKPRATRRPMQRQDERFCAL